MGLFDGPGDGGSMFDVPILWTPERCDVWTGVLQAGAMISFGTSRDGGAMAVSVISQGRTARKWAGDEQELDDIVARLLAAVGNGELLGPPPATPRRAPRP